MKKEKGSEITSEESLELQELKAFILSDLNNNF